MLWNKAKLCELLEDFGWKRVVAMQQNNGFAFRRIGSPGCEILNPNGIVVAWTTDELWATWIVALLNDAPCVRLAQGNLASNGLLPQEGLTAMK